MATVREDTGNSQAESASHYSRYYVPALIRDVPHWPGLAVLARLKPKRHRQRSLTTILRQARRAGADRVVIGRAVVCLNPSPGEGRPAAPTEAADNSWDDLLPPGGRNATH